MVAIAGVLAALLSLSGSAPPHLQIFYRLGGAESISVGEVHGALQPQIEQATGFSVAPPEVMPREAEACRGDMNCLIAVLRPLAIGASYALVVEVEDLGAGDLLALRLLNIGDRTLLAQRGAASGESLIAALESELPRLFQPLGWGPVELTVRVAPEGSLVELEQGLSCNSPCTIGPIPPGTYTLRLSASGRASKTEIVTLKPGERFSLESTLMPASPDRGPPAWLWVGLGVLAAGAVAASIILVVDANSGDDPLCITPDPSRCD